MNQETTSSRPMVLISGGDDDADFLYATGFSVEISLYVRFADGDDVLVTAPAELDRAQEQAKVKAVRSFRDYGTEKIADRYVDYPRLAAHVLRERGVTEVDVSAELPVAYWQQLEANGLRAHVRADLLRAERRRKNTEAANAIHAAQRAAEAACVEVIGRLGTADIRDGVLWADGRPLTSERLKADAESALAEIGYLAGDLIIAGSPGSAMGHYRGEGPIRAHAPVVIDIFPRGSSSHFYGDLTRTVVVGETSDDLRQMHAAVLAALDGAVAEIRAGANGRRVHRRACEILVERGYGTTTVGLEGRQDGPVMNHSLGHGVGLDVHEEPKLTDLDQELEAGDVVTVEPGLYQKGFGGIRIEDTGLVTEDGFRNFTSLSRSLDPRAYL